MPLGRRRGYVQQIVSHPMLDVFFLQGMVMDHDHLIVVSFCHRKPLAVRMALVRSKFEEGSVLGEVGNRPQQSLLLRHIVQPDHEEFVIPMWVGEFHTAIHPELEGCLVDLNFCGDLNPFICLV